MNYLTDTQLQKKIPENLQNLKEPLIVTKKGQPSIFILPYFKEGSKILNEYFENYEMQKQAKKLKKRYQDSLESGESNLKI